MNEKVKISEQNKVTLLGFSAQKLGETRADVMTYKHTTRSARNYDFFCWRNGVVNVCTMNKSILSSGKLIKE